MKKTFLTVLAFVLVFSLCAVAFAAPAGRGQKARFVDEDGDGVCDNCGLAKEECANFVDEDGDGVCDNVGKPGRPNKDEAQDDEATEEGTEAEEAVKPDRPEKDEAQDDEAQDDEATDDTEAEEDTEETVKPSKGKGKGKRGGKCPKQTNKPRCNRK